MINTVEMGKNGITTCIKNYALLLQEEGQEVHILTPDAEESIIQYFHDIKIPLYLIPERKNSTIRYFLALVKLLASKTFDVVHVHGNSCTMAVELFASLLAGCKRRIAHSHNTTCEHRIAHRLLRPLFELSCNGRFACGEDAGMWLFVRKKFNVVKNGIRLSDYLFDENARESIRKELNILDNELLIGHVGGYGYQKNQEFLIEIAKQFKKDSKYKFVLIGDGKTRSIIQLKAKEYGLEEQVIFAGNVDNVPAYLQAMDLFLLPSRYEGIPFVLMEAQAAALPCIVSDFVAREANLCGEFRYLSIEDATVWKHKIQEVLLKETISERRIRQNQWQEQLKQEGYDLKESAKILLGWYLEQQ